MKAVSEEFDPTTLRRDQLVTVFTDRMRADPSFAAIVRSTMWLFAERRARPTGDGLKLVVTIDDIADLAAAIGHALGQAWSL